MSRSVRKSPICGVTVAPSDKKDKQWSHRRLRAKERELLYRESELFESVNLRDVSDPWWFDKDGKQYVDIPTLIERRVPVWQVMGK